MDNKQRQRNEDESEFWIEDDNGGRIYSFEIIGKLGWKAKYLKEVNNEEITIKFWQEVYDENNVLKEIHENIQWTKAIKNYNMTTKKVIADKLIAYLQHQINLAELVAWSEQMLLEGTYEDDNDHTIRNTLAQLGVADVKTFGLEWKDCEAIMQKLGFRLEVKALAVA